MLCRVGAAPVHNLDNDAGGRITAGILTLEGVAEAVSEVAALAAHLVALPAQGGAGQICVSGSALQGRQLPCRMAGSRSEWATHPQWPMPLLCPSGQAA